MVEEEEEDTGAGACTDDNGETDVDVVIKDGSEVDVGAALT